MTKRRLLDWRLFFAVGFMLLVGFVVWSGINAAHRADDNGRRADAALATMQQHDAAAARDRATNAANQRALVGYLKATAAQQAAENRWLVDHHIPIPRRFLRVITPPRIVVRHPRVSHHVKRHRSSSTATPSGPGKSGAHGHHKHPRHGHRHR